MTSMALAAQPTEDAGSHIAKFGPAQPLPGRGGRLAKEVPPWLLKAKPLQLYAEMRGFS